jgi:hypothetical protein
MRRARRQGRVFYGAWSVSSWNGRGHTWRHADSGKQPRRPSPRCPSDVFGLIDLTLGEIQVAGGNEWTPVVTGAGALTGVVVGATSFFRRHVFSFLLMGLGLVAAVVLRDEYLLQPPIVFVDLLGIPLIGIGIGAWLDNWRDRKEPHSSTVVLVGFGFILGVAAFMVAMQGLSGGMVSNNCETAAGVSHCKLFPESEP